MRDRTECAFGG